LIGKSIRTLFPTWFPSPEKLRKKTDTNPYQKIIDWFGEGNTIDLQSDMPGRTYAAALSIVEGLDEFAAKHCPSAKGLQRLFLMELILHALAEYSRLNRSPLSGGARFGDLMGAMLGQGKDE
jgi:magnesium chelatase subunit I